MFMDLMNIYVRWFRQKLGVENEYGEQTEELTLIDDKVNARIEKIYEKDLLEAYIGGDTNTSLYVLYIPYDKDIRTGDLLEVIEYIKVKGFGINDGYNLNITYYRDKDFYNGYPIYYNNDKQLRIYYNTVLNKWCLGTSNIDYYSTDDLENSNWQVENGVVLVGTSVLYSVRDFVKDVSVDNGQNKMVIVDVEDAGGVKRHHLECYCKYREGIY